MNRAMPSAGVVANRPRIGQSARNAAAADTGSLPAPASTCYAVSNARSMATEMRFQLRASASN